MVSLVVAVCYYMYSILGVVSLVSMAKSGSGQGRNVTVSDDSFVNSLGMQMVKIPAGHFIIGYSDSPLPEELTQGQIQREDGDYDEEPNHPVAISGNFYMSALEVSNAQFEEFNISHKAMRGHMNFSFDDNEAAIFISWYEAVEFCKWLSEKENRTYRLPTEAEWEFAARAGTTTYFNTGDTFPKEYQKCQETSWYPAEAPPCGFPKLTTNTSGPNAYGLHDMHGNVEEWTMSWYGTYTRLNETDPMGPPSGEFKVSRGGSHSTILYYLRSANRMGTVPEDKSWYIGMRVVMEDPSTSVPPRTSAQYRFMAEDYEKHHPRNRPDVNTATSAEELKPQENAIKQLVISGDIEDWRQQYSSPEFQGPYQYVKIDEDQNHLPFSHHNHDPGICPCPNGDVFAIWYSTVSETQRELGVVYSRLKKGSDKWDEAEIFWNAPDRNDHAPAMYLSPNGTMYHFNGLSAAATFGNLATVMRVSTDSGYNWSRADLIFSEHGLKHMPVETVIELADGKLLLPTDAGPKGDGATAIHLSPDMGLSWQMPPGLITGIHGAVVQLKNGDLWALGRGNDIDHHMAHSLSQDMGETWKVSRSPFQGIHGGQREVLLRLKEGPIMMIGFANEPLEIEDVSKHHRHITGLYACVSVDEAATWKNFRPISDDGKGRKVETLDGKLFELSYKEGEPLGYMSARQSPVDGMVHVISSRQYYRFNVDWLLSLPPVPPK
ncbi:uncharacterized protein LOC135817730 isoform X2 [Sycon ciliatum]|uniref:uncharacterized protein LOC135817730 isoform X2 n=1 Tax=Sycon ciliatum TaxID=27933 RepID=UPI0031F653AC